MAGAPSAMILGDNLFFGHGLPELMKEADHDKAGGTVFGYHVSDPQRYGVVGFDAEGRVREIIEKPEVPPSNYAVTGLHFLDGTAPARAKSVTPSARGELEITSLLQSYLDDGQLDVCQMGRGYAWLDTGTHASLLKASEFVYTLQKRQGLQRAAPMRSPITKAGFRRQILPRAPSCLARMNMGNICRHSSKGVDLPVTGTLI